MSKEQVTFFTSSRDNSIKMWSLEDGNEKANLSVVCKKTFDDYRFHVRRVLVNKFQTPINEIIAYGHNNTIETWNIVTGKNKDTIRYNQIVKCMAWWKQGQHLIIGKGNDICIIQWNSRERGKIVETLEGHTHDVFELIVIEESNQLLSYSGDKTIRLWNLNTGQEIRQFDGHADSVRAICKLNNNLFASASLDESVKIWNITSGECIYTIKNTHPYWANLLSYSASEQVLVSSGGNNTIKIWDLKLNEVDNKIQCSPKFTIRDPFNSQHTSIEFLDDKNNGTRVFVGDWNGNMYIVDVKLGTCIFQMKNACSGFISSCAVLHKQKDNPMNRKLQGMQQAKILTNIVIKHNY